MIAGCIFADCASVAAYLCGADLILRYKRKENVFPCITVLWDSSWVAKVSCLLTSLEISYTNHSLDLSAFLSKLSIFRCVVTTVWMHLNIIVVHVIIKSTQILLFVNNVTVYMGQVNKA